LSRPVQFVLWAGRLPPQEPSGIDSFHGAAGLLELRDFGDDDASAEQTGWGKREETAAVIWIYTQYTYWLGGIFQRYISFLCPVAASSRHSKFLGAKW